MKPGRGEAFVSLSQDDPSVRKSAKFGSRDIMYFKVFSQASIDVIVSFEEETIASALWSLIVARVKFEPESSSSHESSSSQVKFSFFF